MNNPPAFPRQLPNVKYTPDEAVQILKDYQGMTLRDYFAAAAMQGDMANLTIDSRRFSMLTKVAEIDGITLAAAIAREAFIQADAMLKARANEP